MIIDASEVNLDSEVFKFVPLGRLVVDEVDYTM